MPQFLKPRTVFVGGNGNVERIGLGGDNPVTIQTMWKEPIVGVKDDSARLDSIRSRIAELKTLGCDIIRFAVPDMASAESFVEICKSTTMPLVADIHFDYRLALKCLEGPVGAIRINPGNIGARERVEAVVNGCREKGVAIRIGVNTGSLPKDLEAKVESGAMSRAAALSETAARECAVFDELGFDQFAVSMKASSVSETIEANEDFASRFDVPLHIGVTEAGPLITGVVKSTLAFSKLLREGIGSTIRVSLSSTPENEVVTGLEILRECGKRSGGVTLVSCPRCGRIGFDVHSFMDRWQNELLSMKKDITVAVMGCVVNGPGEGKHADIGIAGAGDKAIIFKKGKIVRTIDVKDADNEFRKELMSL
ncbi:MULTISPECIES: flavodoxin-dependent (E)-4-hydroxy-3-methylbut-2-enyl-diphosphate synthase [Treponema]|uniref:4-hydroxy-3-methylbut-2-en-1-yl diphosphate synthase (flavodoxin) n=2 Tax=Treponema saccharophilum TaxID=165 RepID=H7EMJ7_9SPIR|nr:MULTISPECIES: flavodoxin-dependent (E)-4-hydroxy-3-methylbut-2-enyl-diphosphate synthase [Treponema]EIC01282.1 4-hydroxy-3-methylbut-2-en-1-yl diphosphate synthase [Treponema saccharophilum DSM 2985]MBQ5537867.1 flavodoxin-dependent (E)-4-hydroxy-3-methylbut-2-enyl-diphosphate synthase [Treponema sp.]BDC96036.1 4-hydroxy-3-methylbut-2-en-1-yl diphosphate synthase (flavodoxin) [Treponema saccharophilum]